MKGFLIEQDTSTSMGEGIYFYIHLKKKMYGFEGLGQVEVGMLPWRDERPNEER